MLGYYAIFVNDAIYIYICSWGLFFASVLLPEEKLSTVPACGRETLFRSIGKKLKNFEGRTYLFLRTANKERYILRLPMHYGVGKSRECITINGRTVHSPGRTKLCGSNRGDKSLVFRPFTEILFSVHINIKLAQLHRIYRVAVAEHSHNRPPMNIKISQNAVSGILLCRHRGLRLILTLGKYCLQEDRFSQPC